MYWGLRRDDLCDPGLCHDAPDDGRYDHCPLDRLDAESNGGAGQLLLRAQVFLAAMRAGVQVRLDDMTAEELAALLVLQEERIKFESERGANGA